MGNTIQNRQDLSSHWRSGGLLKTRRQVLLFIFIFFFRQNCQILTGLDVGLYLLPGFVIPLGQTGIVWRDETQPTTVSMQRDTKLQQMQISSSLPSFSPKNGLKLHQKTG